MDYDERIKDLGLKLPPAPKPVASYVGMNVVGNIAYLSGLLPKDEAGLAFKGKIGRDITKEKGKEAARLCALNALALLKSELGSLNKVSRIAKVTGFIASDANFTEQPQVLNGASDLLREVFGEAGLHARSAVGVNVLPLDAAVEIELIVEVNE